MFFLAASFIHFSVIIFCAVKHNIKLVLQVSFLLLEHDLIGTLQSESLTQIYVINGTNTHTPSAYKIYIMPF